MFGYPLLDIFSFIVLFYRQFRICITNASGKAPYPKVVRNLRLPCAKGAVALATEGLFFCYFRLFYNPSVSLRLPPPFTQGRLFAHSIITKIGRENNVSAEIYVSRTVEDAGPYKL